MNQTDQILESDQLASLIQKDNFVGYVYSIDYDTAYIMTNDYWKGQANGIPHNCFLIAATFDPEHFGSVSESEKEVFLFRVIESAKLPQDDDMVRTKIDHYQQRTGVASEDTGRELDNITQNQLQFGGLKCRVLGTFYVKDNQLWLGSDLESYSSFGNLIVYRPRGNALNTIVNYINPIRLNDAAEQARQLGIEAELEPFNIGTVRYTSTTRLHRQTSSELVTVGIQPSDFLARRTAVLGMTRTGKSNLIKQLVSVVKRVSDSSGLPIGQIIYDINGEYANANEQDQGALSEVYESDSVRYRMVETPGFQDLRINFYEQITEGLSIIHRDIEGKGHNPVGYVGTFLNLSLEEPDSRDHSAHTRWQVKRAAYFVMLSRAGYGIPRDFSVRFTVSRGILGRVNAAAGRNLSDPNRGISLRDAATWFENARNANNDTTILSSSGNEWADDTLKVLLDMIVQAAGRGGFITGFRLLTPCTKYHAPNRRGEVSAEIYNHLREGNIVILDLSVGDPIIRENLSKRIASHIFNRSMQDFIEGRVPPNIAFYIEEAHNLIGKGMDITETWPRIAKEGAKYRISLIYATQEVSSMHPNILANTENWFITHLNNEREINELARFYDFKDFSKSLIRAQDVGFARIKTLSGPFVIPVQIDLFDPEAERLRVRQMREQSGTSEQSNSEDN